MRALPAILVALALTGAARASDEVTASLREAEAEYNLGHFKSALEKFETLYKKTGKPALLFNVAQCHRQLGELKEAEISYRSYLRLEAESPNAPVARELLAQVEEARRKEASAKTSPPLGLGTAAPQAAPPPANPPPSAAPPPANPPLSAAPLAAAAPMRATHPVAGSVVLGAAAASAIAGAVFGAQSRSAASDWRAATAEPAWSDARSRTISAATRADVAFVAASVLAAAGASLLVFQF